MRETGILLMLGMLFLALGLLLLFLTLRRRIAALEVFGKALNEIGRGNDNVEAVDGMQQLIQRHDDVGVLAQTLQHMSAEIHAHKEELELQLAGQRAKLMALQEAASREEATQSKSLFLSNMSHEIRTPMNAIIGLSHLMLKTKLDTRQRDYVAKIHIAGASLLAIVNDLLDFTKIEAGKLSIETVDFVLDRTMESVATVVGHTVAEKGLELIFDIPADVPQSLMGDPLRLEQILTNLVNNAVKFTERGEILVQVERVESASAQVKLKFSVRDTGIGMTPEQQQRLFHAFTQADGSNTRKYGGTGLGLTISKRLVELMGGSIWLESEVGVGSTFSFTAWFGLGKNIAPRILPATLRGLRVLIVDDNPMARNVLTGHCANLPLTVEEVTNGEEAVAAVRLAVMAGRPYGLVLMDWVMPNLNGIDAARAIKSDAALIPQPAIVMVTAFGRDDVRSATGPVALDGFLVKPVSASTLVDMLTGLYGDASGSAFAPAVAGSNYHLEGLRVLVVEDNNINQQIAAELMMSAGIVVDVADNGRIAIEKLEAGGRYDIVLMDLQMPEMDGYAATAAIRADAMFEALPIVAMTAHAMAEEREHCLASGMNDHIAKPIDPDVLFATLARWSRRQGYRAPAPTPAKPSPAPVADGLIDTVAALRRLGGKTSLYHSLLARFADDYAGATTQIETLLAAGDRETAERTAHSIKGVAANIGAAAVADAASQLEKAIRNSLEDAAVLLRFGESCNAAIEEIRRIVPAGTVPPQKANEIAMPAAAKESIQRLAAYLSSGDDEALNYFVQHRSTFLSALGTHAAPVERAISDFDFASTLVLLRTAAVRLEIEI